MRSHMRIDASLVKAKQHDQQHTGISASAR
jgi:hypothetical protein